MANRVRCEVRCWIEIAPSVERRSGLARGDPDPAKSRDHVLLSVLAERRFRERKDAELTALLNDLTDPPIAEVGALPLNDFIPSPSERHSRPL